MKILEMKKKKMKKMKKMKKFRMRNVGSRELNQKDSNQLR